MFQEFVKREKEMIKNIIAVLITLALIVSLGGCAQNGSEQPEQAIGQSLIDAPYQPIQRQDIPSEYKWDLTQIFADTQAFETALAEIEDESFSSIMAYAGTLNDHDTVFSFLAENDRVNQSLERLYTYAMLKSAEDRQDNDATAILNRVLKVYYSYYDVTAFAAPELLLLPDDFWDSFLQEERMRPYSYQIRLMIENSKYVLPENEAVLLTPLSNAANNAYLLYSKMTDADMEFPEVTDSQGNSFIADEANRSSVLFSHSEREFRKEMSEANLAAYGRYRNTFAQNMDTFVQINVSSAGFHNYNSAREAALIANAVDPAIFTNIIEIANENLDTAHRNVALRKIIMGVDEVYSSDLVYPLTEDITAIFSYEDGKNTLMKALAPLGPDYLGILKKAFAESWIDVYPSEGKDSGAFCAYLYTLHPYILMNYMDDFDSVTTLAHELGHAGHMYLSAQNQESISYGSPTTFTTEVASTVNELLLSDYLIRNAGTNEEKLYYLFSELTTLDGTFFRQVMHSEFEDAMYQIVEEGGSLTADVLEGLWTGLVEKYYGGDIAHVEGMEYGWARIPHFYYSFYTYQYATSIAAASVISQRITNGEPGAVEDYLTFLKAGNSADGVELLKVLGVDMTRTDFADPFIERYNNLIDQIEELLEGGR